VFRIAQHAPSGCNSQPWKVYVLSGAERFRLERGLIEEILAGAPRASAFGSGEAKFVGALRDRQVACGAKLYQALGVARDDRDARVRVTLQNWCFFGAPHVAVIALPVELGAEGALDVGIYMQSVMLLLQERGISSCPQGSLAFYPRPIV